jgi:hypothetical protein
MALFELPVLTGETTLGEAIAALDQHGVSALLMPSVSGWAVLDQAILTRRGNHQDMPLAAVLARGRDVQILSAAPPRSGASAAGFAPTEEATQAAPSEPEFTASGLMRISMPDTALVRNLALSLRYCVCPAGDVWAPGQTAKPGICDFDNLKLTCK